MDKEFLNIKELGEYLGIKTSTLYFYVENGSIPHYRVGRLIRFKRQDIDQWMEGNKKEVPRPEKEAKRILKKPGATDLDIERIVKKTIDEARRKRYTSDHGKLDQVKGLGKEVSDGSL
ncbi:MAG: helix-turn-helix domain-containing protein [Thermodesulfobacteriota bacterium]|jgi:excisionase family DNA binding protein